MERQEFVDSKVPDAQAAYENAIDALIATLAGADVVHNAVYGILEAGVTACYEQFAISNEICGAIKRIAKGIKVTRETIALRYNRESWTRKESLDSYRCA